MPTPASENPLERIPPHDEAAEMGVLGSMLCDAHAAGVGVELIVADDFYLPRHQVLFALLAELHQHQPDLDPLFVKSELERRALVERIGGRETLGKLIEGTPTPANIERYCRIVRDRAIERSLLQTAGQIIQLTQRPEPGETSQDLVQRAEELIFKIADTRSGNEPVSIVSVMNQVLTEIDRHVEAKKEGKEIPSPAIPTHLLQLDKMFAGGMWPGEVTVVAARPSVGKTTLALNIAFRVASKSKIPTCIFSMEMPKEQISKNLLCLAIAESELRNDPHITSTMMRRYEFDDKMYQTVKYAVQSMREVPVFIDDSPGLTPGELRARARRLHHRDGVRLILIDYLQLMQAGKHHDNREQAVAELSRQVKQLARELSIPVVLLSQLRRPIQGQEAQRPNLTDLRESGAIEQDADVVVMLHREMENRLMTRKAWAIVQKNRNGEIGDTELAYWPEQFRFHNYSAEVEQAGVPVGATA